MISREVAIITDYLINNEFFKTIKDIDKFADLLFITYSRRCDVMNELRKMNIWLIVNPRKSNKKNWKRFIINWMNRK